MIWHWLALQIDAKSVGIPEISANDATFNAIMGLVYTALAALCLFFIIRGALQMIVAGNDPGQVKQARDMIVYACIALGASTVVFAVIWFVAERFTA